MTTDATSATAPALPPTTETPGPWVVVAEPQPGYTIEVHDRDGSHVATVDNFHDFVNVNDEDLLAWDARARGNAALLAAAPELREALRGMLICTDWLLRSLPLPAGYSTRSAIETAELALKPLGGRGERS